MKYTQRKTAIVLLEDGTIFYGKAVGAEGSAFGEILANLDPAPLVMPLWENF